jgi:predicted signal transduction protein with EAL and GGDEF domain
MSLAYSISSAVVEIEATGSLTADSLKDLSDAGRFVKELETAHASLRQAHVKLILAVIEAHVFNQ